MEEKVLQTYIWEDPFDNYTAGLIVCVAYSLEEALTLINKENPSLALHLKNRQLTPTLVSKPELYYVRGGD
jgi:hypothetical protein